MHNYLELPRILNRGEERTRGEERDHGKGVESVVGGCVFLFCVDDEMFLHLLLAHSLCSSFYINTLLLLSLNLGNPSKHL